jgi:hypothetical protein
MHNWVAVTIAFGVFLVGYAQWRTANQRVVVDLFEKRLAAYNELEGAVGQVMREGEVDEAAFRRFLIGKMDARFLFGREVLDYLEAVYRDIVSLKTVYRNDVIDTKPDRERERVIDLKFEVFGRVSDFALKAPEVFGPYMRLDQKNTPFWRPW